MIVTMLLRYNWFVKKLRQTTDRQTTDNGTYQNHSEPNTMCWLTKRWSPSTTICIQGSLWINFQKIYKKWNLLENMNKMRQTATFYDQRFKCYPFWEKSNLESKFANQDPNPAHLTDSFVRVVRGSLWIDFQKINEKWNLLENMKKMRPIATFYDQRFNSYPFW
jgi:virulence-associated protein VapD